MGSPIEPIDGGQVQGGNPDAGDNTPGPNPAWSEVLDLLPEQFHSVVTPHFTKWDQSAQSRIEAANNSLKDYEPYKPFLEHGITSDEMEQGLRILYEINNNPRNVYDALAEAYKYNAQAQESPVANPNGEGEEENPLAQLPPEVMSQLGQQGDLLQTVAQIVLNDANAKQAAQADNELDAELNALKERIGDFDEGYVLAQMQNGYSAEDAGNAFLALKQSFIQNQPFAPGILGNSNGGSGVPSNAIDPTTLSSKDTRSLVAQMLEQAARQQ